MSLQLVQLGHDTCHLQALTPGTGTGASTTAIAAELGLSEGTIRNDLSEAISKVGAGNRAEAARLAREKGWL